MPFGNIVLDLITNNIKKKSAIIDRSEQGESIRILMIEFES